MRPTRLLLLVASFVVSAVTEGQPLGRLIPRLMRDGDVPGISIVVIRDRRIAWERAFGVANANTRSPLTRDAIFESASLGKPVFAYAVLRLADANVLSLDVPLSQYLAEPVSDPRMKNITARMVLTHTTGYQNEVMPSQALQVHFDPGTRFSYSGAGYLHLQRVIEALTGEPLPAVMQRLVFDPLDMRDSGYVWQPRYEQRKVYGHTAAGVVNERRRPASATVATLHTTARDYARFVVALMNGTGLTPASVVAMMATQVPVDASGPVCLSPCSGTMSTALSWGLGVGIEKTANGTAFWHWGENHGDTHTFMMGRDDGDGVVVFANSGNGHSIMPEIVAAVLGRDHPAFAWMGYESYRAPARQMLRDILAHGVRSSELDALTEPQINGIGYALLARGRVGDALAVFRRNAERFPQSANVHDSLGEAWMTAGHRTNAIASYRRSLALDPQNANAAAMLEKLAQ